MKYFIIAGEASGDIHGSELVRSIKRHDAEAQFRFFGGDMMAASAGSQPIVNYRDMAYMGFVEVAKHLGAIMGFLKTAKHTIDEFAPDAVILIDYPSFNLKVAKYTHRKGIKTFYFISPKVWAWKEYRVKQIKKYITALYSILPFETEFFARHNYNVEYVGNPTVKEIAEASAKFATADEFRRQNHLDERPIIAIVPGSRVKEIRDNLPQMLMAAKRFADHQMVIAGAPNIDESLYGEVMAQAGIADRLPILHGKSFELVHHSRAALVTSGTATLETAILGTPQVVCYRMGGKRWLYFLYEHVLTVKYISLPNLIANREVIPELILHLCNDDGIARHLECLLGDTPQRQAMLDGYAEMAQRLGTNDCTDTAAQRLIAALKH